MTAGGLLLTLAGLLLAAGLVGVVGAVRGVSFLPERSPSVRSSSRRGDTPLLLGALVTAVVFLPVLVVVAVIVSVWLPGRWR